MRLYHVSVGMIARKRWFCPRVPKYRLCGEDDETKRICFSDSIERAVAAIPDADRAQNSCIIVYPFDVEEDDPNLVHWRDVWEKHAVVDAYLTHEYWYLTDVTLAGECYETNEFAIEEQRVFGPEAKGYIQTNLMDYLKNKLFFSQESLDSVKKTIAPLDSNALFDFIKKTYQAIPEHEILIAGISEFAFVVTQLQLTPAND